MARWSEIPTCCQQAWISNIRWRANWAYYWSWKSSSASWLLIPAICSDSINVSRSYTDLQAWWNDLRELSSGWMDPVLEGKYRCHFRIRSWFLSIWDLCCWRSTFTRLVRRKFQLVDSSEAVPRWLRLGTRSHALLWRPWLHELLIRWQAYLRQASPYCIHVHCSHAD